MMAAIDRHPGSRREELRLVWDGVCEAGRAAEKAQRELQQRILFWERKLRGETE